MKKKCKICGKEFSVIPKLSRNRLYCDNCRYINCLFCKKSFLIKPSGIDKIKFCSKNCYTKWSKGRKKTAELIKKMADGHRGRKTGKFINCINCGKEKYKYPRDLKRVSGKEYFCSMACKTEFMKRNASPKRNNKEEEKKWKRLVFKRDNYTCSLCFTRGGKSLNAHHLEKWSEYPEKRFDLRNGITLCKSCHLFIHSKLFMEWAVQNGYGKLWSCY
jgi:YHS domain-containing protein